MNRNIIRYIQIWQYVILGVLIFSSCSDIDDYKDFVKDGEVSYTGKITGVTMYPGYERIKITGLLESDPKIVKVKLFWNNYSDSTELDVNRSGGVDTVTFLLENLPENVYNFVFYTVDGEGNYSVPVTKTGTVYGERYRLSLLNRIVKSTFKTDSGLYVIWGESNYLGGLQFTELVYTKNNDQKDTLYEYPLLASDTMRLDSMFLNDYKTDSPIEISSYYKPNPLCIDYFSTNYQEVKLREDVTSTYLNNTSEPFAYSSWDGGHYGILADWTANDAVKNHNGYGGYELYKGEGLLAVDAGFGAPAIVNGKIYQPMDLPAGSYTLEADIVVNSIAGTKYITVNSGSELVDFANIDQAIAYADAGGGILEFDLSEQTTVSLGFSIDLPGNGEYFRVSEIRLYKLE